MSRKSRHHRRRSSRRRERKVATVNRDERPHVKLSPHVDVVSICGEGPSDETSVTLTKSEERYRQFINEYDEARNESLMRENGWCSRDGVPWCRSQMPKDEAALLKKGVVSRNGARSTYCSPDPAFTHMGSPRFFDELELLKSGYVDRKGRVLKPAADNSARMPTQLPYEPISVAELNSRGLLDQHGKIHFGVQSLAESVQPLQPRGGSQKANSSSSSKQYLYCTESSSYNVDGWRSSDYPSETKVSFSPLRDGRIPFTKSSKNGKRRKHKRHQAEVENASGVIRCEVGSHNDPAVVTYTVTNDGRNYDMKTRDGNFVRLEFNKKHGYLAVN